jgi:type IV pilus assembly protein PilM
MHVNTFQKFLRHYFPVPEYLNIPSFGVDISYLSVRFMEINPDKDRFKVGRFGHERLKNLFAIEQEESRNEVKGILAKWKGMHDMKFVEVSLPEEKAYLFTINIPFDTHMKMRSSIEFTLEENVPLNPAESIFDYRIIHENGDGTVAVAVTVLPLDIVNSYIELFESVGISPISFLIEAQALSKAIIKKDDMGTYFIINVGEIKTGLFVISEGSVQFTSTLTLGGRNFTDALMKGFNISREEAENIKRTKGLAHKEEDREVLSTLINAASALREEIEKIYVYWHSHEEKKNPSAKNSSEAKIILSGKDSLMSGFREYINQSLKVETQIANVWTNVATFEEYIPPISAVEAIDFGRAIGLALPKIN